MQMVMAPVLLELSEPSAWMRTKASAPAWLAISARSPLLMETSLVVRIISTS